MLSIANQVIMEIAFAVVRPPENSPRLYINTRMENPHTLISHPPSGSPFIQRVVPSHDIEHGHSWTNLASLLPRIWNVLYEGSRSR